MIRVPKSILSIGAAGLALAALTLLLPKAAHAVVAALVQVVNTASNPVVTQTIGQQAGQAIQLVCGDGDGLGYCTQNGSASPVQYAVPPGQSLMITAVDVFSASAAEPSTCSLAHQVSVAGESKSATGVFLSSVNYLQYEVGANSGGLHGSYPSGVVFGSGLSLGLSRLLEAKNL